METLTADEDKANSKIDPYTRIQHLNEISLKLLILWVPKSQFFGKLGLQHVTLYALVHSLSSLLGLYELICSFLYSESTLEFMTHFYGASYILVFGFQFTYLCRIFKEMDEDRMHIGKFNTTRMVPDFAKQALGENLREFKPLLWSYTITGTITIIIFVVDIIAGVIVELTTTGTVQEVHFLIVHKELPLWGQAVVTTWAFFSFSLSVAAVTSGLLIMGIRTVKIKTQCEIINAAMAGAEVDIRACIQDHVEVIRFAKRSIEIFRILNEPTFLTIYILVAVQMLSLSLIEPTGADFFAIALDFLTTFSILLALSWFSSAVTLSMASIAQGAYFAPWCGRDKSYGRNVLLMIQMAQRPYQQKIWFNSVTIERATTLRILQWSYSFYALLMIFQGQK